MKATERQSRMAVHGAGHAAVGVRLGLSLVGINLSTNGGPGGHVQFRPPGKWFHDELGRGYDMSARARRRLEVELITTWAGTVAEERAFPSEHAIVEHALGEFKVANSDIALADGDLALIVVLGSHFTRGDDDATTPFLELMRVRALRLVEEELTWLQVMRLADELLKTESLSGSRARALMAGVREAWSQLDARPPGRRTRGRGLGTEQGGDSLEACRG